MMKSRSIIGLVAVGLAVLLLFAACSSSNRVSNDPPAPPAPLAPSDPQAPSTVQGQQSPPAFQEKPICGLGGPYVFRAKASKVKKFATYQGNQWIFSEGVLLDENLFLDSVEADQSNLRQGFSSLKYNYVVSTSDCNIYVAKWTMSATDILEALETFGCDGNYDLYAISGNMINFWPEDFYKLSPCWLDKAEDDGILDTMGKHFILAQEPGDQKINDMDFTHGPNSAVHRSVAYGGEIVVNLNDCTYTINNGSGTYKPWIDDADLSPSDYPSYLNDMAKRFGELLKVAPRFVDSPDSEEVKYTSVLTQIIPKSHCNPMSGPTPAAP